LFSHLLYVALHLSESSRAKLAQNIELLQARLPVFRVRPQRAASLKLLWNPESTSR
jgi:hypothetical protein